jgi:GH15 family glucan-1,4-alpha-glucosidase
VGRNGSVDWLCLPRFDSSSCFAALLGEASHGCWRIAPAGNVRDQSRRYRPGTLVLETDFVTDDGEVRLIDFMPHRGDGPPRLMRIVEGIRGPVPMRMELLVRPDYASICRGSSSHQTAPQRSRGPTRSASARCCRSAWTGEPSRLTSRWWRVPESGWC